MSNEEIRIEILGHQKAIQSCLASCCSTFELSTEITEHKKAIDKLRQQCTHVNTNHEVQKVGKYCAYCGKTME